MKHPMPPRSTDLWQSLLSPVGQGVKPPHSTWNCIHGNLAQYARHVSDRTGSAGFGFFYFVHLETRPLHEYKHKWQTSMIHFTLLQFAC
jgi:hypothetical protein